MDQLTLLKKIRAAKDSLDNGKEAVRASLNDLEDYVTTPPTTIEEAVRQIQEHETLSQSVKDSFLQSLDSIQKHIR